MSYSSHIHFLRSRLLTLSVCLLLCGLHAEIRSQALPYRDKSLAVETRVKDLVGRMTLEEKNLQMSNAIYPDEISATHTAGIPSGYGVMNGPSCDATLLKDRFYVE